MTTATNGTETLTWPDDGPAIVQGGWDVHDRRANPVYRKPTCTSLYSRRPSASISDRADHIISFTFTEGGRMVSYSGTVSQDDHFRVLLAAGLIRRETESA